MLIGDIETIYIIDNFTTNLLLFLVQSMKMFKTEYFSLFSECILMW